MYAFCNDLVFVYDRFRGWLLAPNTIVGIRGPISIVSGVNSDCIKRRYGAVLGVKGFGDNALADRGEVVRLFKCLMREALNVNEFEHYPHPYFFLNFMKTDTVSGGPISG